MHYYRGHGIIAHPCWHSLTEIAQPLCHCRNHRDAAKLVEDRNRRIEATPLRRGEQHFVSDFVEILAEPVFERHRPNR